MPEVRFIAAIDDRRGLAKGQKLPWDIPTDRKYFYDQLASAPGLMGWKTFVSAGRKPFAKSPKTYLVTHKQVSYDGVEVVHDLGRFMDSLQTDLWVIGGGDIYAQLLDDATELVLTRVQGEYGCDVFFPPFEDRFRLVWQSGWHEESGHRFQFQRWVSK